MLRRGTAERTQPLRRLLLAAASSAELALDDRGNTEQPVDPRRSMIVAGVVPL